MKLNALTKTMAASAVALLIAGCGGGGGGENPAPNPVQTQDPSLQVSGTAATGLALANAAVQVKCATGNGTATTDATGAYTVTLTGGALPCMIKVTGTAAGGVEVTLHSVTEAGSTNAADQRTSAVANVTPITEMIVAQLRGALPKDIFAAFQGQAITPAQLADATSKVLAALKGAGVDLGAIDPFKATLVPKTDSTEGNQYDKLLDALGAKVQPEALPLVVNQIATAAGNQSTSGLADAMAAVSGGNLHGCPAVVSGKFRTLDYWGRTVVRELNFSNKTMTTTSGTATLTITPDATQACAFTASGTVDGLNSEWSIVFGPSGIGSYRARFVNPDTPGVVGYIFPVQQHDQADVAGTWSFLQSGFLPGDGTDHFPGQLTIGSGTAVGVCDLDLANKTCVPDTGANLNIGARTDGGFDLKMSSLPVAVLYGYRAPNGSLTVFGSTNPSGSSSPTVQQTSIVAGKLSPLSLPTVGTEVKYWDLSLTQFFNTSTNTMMTFTAAPVADANTVIAVDAQAKTAQRKRLSDGREDLVHYNDPLPGLRKRDPGLWNGVPFAGVVQFTLPGAGVTISVNSAPRSSGATHIYNVSVNRP